MRKLSYIVGMILSLTGICSAHADPTQGLNDFAFNLYRQTQQSNDQNIVIAPYSLSSLLGLLINGAAGNTRAQLINLLHINIQDLAALNAMTGKLTQGANDFLIANALWGDKSLNYKKSFTDTLSASSSNQFYTVDFIKQPQAAVSTINDWVNKNTKGYIPQIISDNVINSLTRLILTNAIYFKGLWQLPFKPALTQAKSFTLANGSNIQTSMMQQHDKLLYSENDLMQMLQLAYSKSTLAMLVLLPKTGHNLSEIEKGLNAGTFSQLTQSLVEQDVILSFPKFKLSSTFDNLSQTLQMLGLKDAFSPSANFSNLSDSKLAISDVIQKALIQVDEQGTVAAAATTILMATAVMMGPIQPIIFNANHPFLFVLYDTQSGLVLFMGQVVNPTNE